MSMHLGVICRKWLTRSLFTYRRTVELVQPEKKTAGMREVKEVISAMQNSPTAGYLQELSLHERIMLASVLKCVKKEGVEEVKWGDVSQFLQSHANRLGSDGCSLFIYL